MIEVYLRTNWPLKSQETSQEDFRRKQRLSASKSQGACLTRNKFTRSPKFKKKFSNSVPKENSLPYMLVLHLKENLFLLAGGDQLPNVTILNYLRKARCKPAVS